ncbi:Kinesin-like protein KIF14 [Tupaia chinensis]|uniref:Kinesin-like protein KIF14 n=1 Tax=Tupaia chinensis TaxID=246437 RepID=L9K5T0_TUPCH|nr:Kinesin-like protein KIF14 [Tupaia chinensis]
MHSAHSRNHSDSLGLPSSHKGSSLAALAHTSRLQLCLKSDVSECENDDPLLKSASKIRDINSTYVISACKKTGDLPLTPNPKSRLTLQRRTPRNKESSVLGSEPGVTAENTVEPRLALQRRVNTHCVEKRGAANVDSAGRWGTTQDVGCETGNDRASEGTDANVNIVNNDKTSFVASSVQLAEGLKDVEVMAKEKYKETLSVLSGANENVALKCGSESAPCGSRGGTEVGRSGYLAVKRTQSKLDVRVPGIGNLHHRSIGKDSAKNTNKLGNFEKRTPVKCMTEHRLTPKCSALQHKSPAASTPKNRTPNSLVQQRPKSSLLANKRERSQENTLPAEEEIAVQNTSAETDLLKVESSQVTVAVRVRPFSKREKSENASQVVFMNGEEITVKHPDMKQVYTFVYDVSFWSFDEHHPHYASQTAVYETLASPLLERAFEGYNTCLFAYGQTGSGKSYTMMGFSEEPGIIPRFCEDLFAQIAKKRTQEVSYHLEMSFFEVYNEKIHDLLVCKGENGQRKQPLRVREHPVFGPYVEALSMNVVSSYSDIQSWLELGNKQRATAATGMNDKSSRSHSVFTLVMTQTKTELVEGEEHDHRIMSRINLVDLAGSERCSAAHTSGERLKEGVSINKSLLTLGKVISALSEQANRKRVFIPYRESVLTWQVSFYYFFGGELLKESLGGNSKTAMIATISPAASNIEETLSTLRYANQARLIVNVAKVNEDMNAKLIRELKAEIEKLKAAQRNIRNIDPERYRLCRQEITSLRMKLHQQERDMAEMQRVWKEKFEQAEKRKLQETKELQKAGITFQMDNHLPNLVNLNEDPQLSEMLLYMIKEGTTTVGKYRADASHDIQLSGVLIADDHCTIRNFGGTVSIVPAGEAKTYVNGKRILEPTVLHHGDRVILGGDHYFRFNHPVEVQIGKRTTGRDTLTSEGPKDFEFAKNELLVAQRSQLEAEMKEEWLKAKEEMMQEIQIAKEMAQQQLSSQKAAYEGKIKALEAELKEECQRKKMQEINNQKANHKIEELQEAKQHLEQEVYLNRKRLEMETLATKQALEDHSIRHARILEALETEKQKIAKEVQILQQNRSNKDKSFMVQSSWSSMKLSMMIQEANAISNKLKKYYVFGRHDVSGKGGPDTSIRVRNLQLGISTFWSLEKFESKLAAMKELYENNGSNRGEEVFCDPEDEWEPDVTNAPVSSFSRRRSRSLMKNRRISGCLQDIQVHPIENLLPAHSSVFSDRATQSLTIRIACAFEQLVLLLRHWLRDALPCAGAARLEDELRQEVKKLGGYLQLFLQGCCSDISSMVKEAQKKVIQIIQQAVKYVGQLTVLKGSKLHFLEDSNHKVASDQEELVVAVCDGIGLGMKILLDCGLEKAKELQQELSKECTQEEVTEQIKANAIGLIRSLEDIFAEWKMEHFRTQEENSGYQDSKKIVILAPEFLKLNQCLEKAIQMIISTLRGCHQDVSLLRDCVEGICNVARGFHSDVCVPSSTSVDSCQRGPPQAGHRELESLAKSLLLCFEFEERPNLLKPWETRNQNSRKEEQQPRPGRTDCSRPKGVPKRVYELHRPSPAGGADGCMPARIQWV